MTKQEFIDGLKTETGTHDVIVYLESDVKMKKTGNPYNGKVVIKKNTLSGYIGKSYADERIAIDNARQDTTGQDKPVYVANQRTWGILINPYLVVHKNNYYLQLFVKDTGIPVYTVDGIIIDELEILPWLQKKPNTDGYEILIRDISFENIKKLTFKGVEHVF